MVYDYFASDEFQELLSLYNKNVREGNSYYFDIDDFISLSDYFVEIGDASVQKLPLQDEWRINSKGMPVLEYPL